MARDSCVLPGPGMEDLSYLLQCPLTSLLLAVPSVVDIKMVHDPCDYPRGTSVVSPIISFSSQSHLNAYLAE
jgi:hypothetical protein